MQRRMKTALGFLLALIAAVVLANRLPLAPSAPQAPSRVLPPPSSQSAERPAAPGATAPAATPEAGAAAPRTAFGAEVGFRTRPLLAEHYQKHGREFGDATLEDYLRMAQSLRDRPATGEVLELVRSDGTITRFDRGTGAFLAFNRDGTIRTFFRPRDGERYFRRQALRQAR